MLATFEDVIGYLQTFNGPKGKCARLGQLAYLLDSGTTDWRKTDGVRVAGGNGSDPTASSAASRDVQLREYAALEEEVGRVGSLIKRVRHGEVLDDYYLEGDDVMWSQLAREYGVTRMTILRWRDTAVSELRWLI